MDIAVVTVFPGMLEAVERYAMPSRAIASGALRLRAVDPRDFTADVHRSVDDRPYGGGPGMVMRFEPLRDAVRHARAAVGGGRCVYLTPQGRRLDQARVEGLAGERSLVLLCGRYEGVDERLIESEVDEEISIGDYVLSGGELAAMVVIDAVARLLPGVLGHEASAALDSFGEGGLLDHPHYTRPPCVDGREVPAVLRGGDHGAIRRWRLKQALGRTYERRPDLLEAAALDDERRRLLEEWLDERAGRRARGAHERTEQ